MISIKTHPPKQLKYLVKAKLALYSPDQQAQIRKEIVDELGIDRSTLSDWENISMDDKKMIPADQLRAIAKKLYCTTDDLFNDIKKK